MVRVRRGDRLAVAAAFVAVALLATALPATPCSAALPEPGSGVLVAAPATWDGRIIAFTGEAIDEAMVRGDGAWVHLNDDAYARRGLAEGAPLTGFNSGLGVWLDDAALAERIGLFGGHRTRGDLVTVHGTFNAACAQHGGDMDLHAISLEVVAPGVSVGHRVTPWKVALAAALFALVAGLGAVRLRVVTRAKRGLGDAV